MKKYLKIKKIKILNEINEQISNVYVDNKMNYTQYKYFNNIFKKKKFPNLNLVIMILMIFYKIY